MTGKQSSEANGAVRVLLADDDEAYTESLRVLIERQPELRVVGSAKDGLEAVELAELLAPDAIVLDLHMPRLDGVAATARLRDQHPHLCLIALTGDDAPSVHQAAHKAGADAVLLKTELVDRLLERLARIRAAPQRPR